MNSISKVFERLMYRRLYEHLRKNNILHFRQFGFQKYKTTEEAVLTFLNDVLYSMENNEIPIGLCYDMSRAFDSVNSSILLDKLKLYGVTEPQHIKWFSSYLDNRPWYFSYQNSDKETYVSDVKYCDVGVPQGSILGPLLFIIYINNIFDSVEDLKTKMSVYADDSNCVTSVKEETQVVEAVRKCNFKFGSWTQQHGIKNNENKMAILIFQRMKSRIPPEIQDRITNSARLLGITVDSKLTFQDHVDNIASKLSSGIFCLYSIRSWAGIDLLKSIYFALIQSHLIYCINVWGPFLTECR